jgi:predicted nucleic acid-binding protein
MKIVLDANVVVAAFASRGLCESILELCLTSHEIVLSQELLEQKEKGQAFILDKLQIFEDLGHTSTND